MKVVMTVFAETTITSYALQIIGAVLGSIFAIGSVIAGSGYLWSKFNGGRNQGAQEKAELQETLKELSEAFQKKLEIVEGDYKEALKEIGRLSGIVEEQAKQGKWFESIMVEALDGFFGKNPDLAFELSKKIGTKKRP